MNFKNYLYLVTVCTVVVVLSIIAESSVLQIFGAVFGIVYVFLVAKEKRISQIFGIVSTAIYGLLMYNGGLYGTSIYDFVYCIPIQIYTFYTWGKNKDGKNKKEISRYSNIQRIIFILIVIVLTLIYVLVASKLSVNFPLVDGVSIILGLFGMYFVSQKKIEQWYAFIISNIVTIVYWTILCAQDISNLPMLLMWAVYIINNSYGLYLWTKKIKANNTNK